MKLKFSKFYSLRSPSLEIEPLEIEKHLVKVFFFFGGGGLQKKHGQRQEQWEGVCACLGSPIWTLATVILLLCQTQVLCLLDKRSTQWL